MLFAIPEELKKNPDCFYKDDDGNYIAKDIATDTEKKAIAKVNNFRNKRKKEANRTDFPMDGEFEVM